jgi:TolA-binding protein
VILCLSAAVGCSSVQQRVADTDNRVDTLEAQIADLQAAQHNLTLRLTEIRQQLEGGVSPVPTQPGEPAPDVRALQSEIGSLGEQLLTLAEQVTALSAQLATMQEQLRAQARQQVEGTPTEQSPGQAQQQEEQIPAEPEVDPPPGDAASVVFDAAFADYLAGEYVLAVDGFEEYLRRYPATEKAGEALYWIGECLSAQEEHSQARGRFLRVILEYPTSEMVAGARLRAALEAIELGQLDAGIQELRSVVEHHPGTDALLIACLQLEQMLEPLPGGCLR